MDARRRRATKPTSPESRPHNISSTDKPASSSSSSTFSSSSSAAAKMDGPESPSWRQHWMFFAVASGACAAFNGVFAKLTTTELTTNLSTAIAKALGIQSHSQIVEIIVRTIFFILNLAFNGIVSVSHPPSQIKHFFTHTQKKKKKMWSLFTTALARGKSATQVSIMNTSTNFLVTAFTGFAIFSEALPPMWWAGASLLVAGSVIAGRKDEGEGDGAKDAAGEAYEPVPAGSNLELEEDVTAGERYRDEDIPDLGELRS
ncbi:uncharacterized protein Triagg1_8533 [Trichoderma aggressivum f. europaeum]|uniref:EamA domain-containing protein n=1 Tax=Trichoderma aggressivum f. europaeum TaxID=173218 RepID=A0AAE1IBX8_9HYPO|nr:hypothetical protein Triagg1_8533 [Trichoderma aggressivum f. europaeum]